MYVNELEFDNFIAPVLSNIYGPAINCTLNDCHFHTTCDKVKREGTGLYFSIASEMSHYVQINVMLEDYLIDGRKQWDQDEDVCYLPIFVVDPA